MGKHTFKHLRYQANCPICGESFGTVRKEISNAEWECKEYQQPRGYMLCGQRNQFELGLNTKLFNHWIRGMLLTECNSSMGHFMVVNCGWQFLAAVELLALEEMV